MEFFATVLMLATFLCSLVAGFLFAFAIVVMPGISSLGNGEFIRAFQVMDRVIQNNQPIFLLVWVGSVLVLILCAIIGIAELAGLDRVLLMIATCKYVFVVQLPTIVVNIPLNNKLQTLDVDAMGDNDLKLARQEFEPRWNRWNVTRTVFACASSILLIFVLFRQ